MPLDTEVGLGPGDVVLDGDPDPSKRGTSPHVHCVQTVGWLKTPLLCDTHSCVCVCVRVCVCVSVFLSVCYYCFFF